MRCALLLLVGWTSATAQAAPLIAVLPATGGRGRDAASIEGGIIRSLAGHPQFELMDPAASGAALRRAKLMPKDRHYLGRAARALDAELVVTVALSANQVTVVLHARNEKEIIRAKLRRDSKSGEVIARTLYPRWKKDLIAALPSAAVSPDAPAAMPAPNLVSKKPGTPPTPAAAPAPATVEPETWLPKHTHSDDLPEMAPTPSEPAAEPPPPAPAPAPTPAAPRSSAPPVRSSAPAASADAQVPASSTADSASRPSLASPPKPPILELALGGGALTRNLSYNQDLFGGLGGYTLGAGAALAGSLGFYPFAIFSHGFFANVGLVGSAVHTIGAGSRLGDSIYPTLADQWNAGLRVRVPLDPVELGISVRYGGQEFRFGLPPLTVKPSVPGYTYGLVSGVVDARFAIGKVFAILVDAGYLYVASDGIADSGFFPHAKVNGLEAGLTLAFAVLGPVELRVGADYQRFFFAMHSAAGDAHVAGGAVDQYLESTLGLAVRIN